jgi:heme oxygenase
MQTARKLLDELRTQTEEHHRRTEAAFDLRAACASKDAYVKLLTKMLSLYRPLEKKFDSLDFKSVGIDWPSRRKVPLLEKDLIALGASMNVPEVSIVGLSLDTVARALGALYVIEGSTLGGQYIRKAVGKMLNLDASNGCAFFIGYDDQTRPMWDAFTQAGNAYGEQHPSEIEPSVGAAKATFELFEKTFTQS